MKMAPLILTLTLTAVTSAPSLADDRGRDRDKRVSTELSSYNEVHFIASPPALRGAISTTGTGEFKARIDDDTQQIHYELTYGNLEGAVTQAHIHFGQKHTVGGIVVWLCQTSSAPAPARAMGLPPTPTCPQAGTVTGTVVASDVQPVTGQGIAANEFDELVRAIRAGATYANVHSQLFPPGEIRGQIGHGGHESTD